MDDSGRIVWLDMEMSGLDPDHHRVLEVAVLVTSGDLTILAEGPNLVVHQPESVLEAMDDWNRRHHGASGLIQKVRESALDEQAASEALLAFVKQHCAPRMAPLGGNSIHQDRRFLYRYMPSFDAYLHYRNVDVSTVKELVRRWYPDVLASLPKKREAHRALDDIRESIEELKHYRQHAFR
jgi:oligoribonuclease